MVQDYLLDVKAWSHFQHKSFEKLTEENKHPGACSVREFRGMIAASH